MKALSRLFLYQRLSGSSTIARRYFLVNGFDGALAMLGIVMGFSVSGAEQFEVIISTCLGAAIALSMTGKTGHTRLYTASLRLAVIFSLTHRS